MELITLQVVKLRSQTESFWNEGETAYDEDETVYLNCRKQEILAFLPIARCSDSRWELAGEVHVDRDQTWIHPRTLRDWFVSLGVDIIYSHSEYPALYQKAPASMKKFLPAPKPLEQKKLVSSHLRFYEVLSEDGKTVAYVRYREEADEIAAWLKESQDGQVTVKMRNYSVLK